MEHVSRTTHNQCDAFFETVCKLRNWCLWNCTAACKGFIFWCLLAFMGSRLLPCQADSRPVIILRKKKKLVPLLLPRTTYIWSSMWWHVERKVRQNHKLRLEGDFVSKLFMWLWMWHRKTLWWQKSLQFVVFYLNVCMLSERAIKWCLKSCCSPGCRVAFRTRRPIQGNARVASSENKLW